MQSTVVRIYFYFQSYFLGGKVFKQMPEGTASIAAVLDMPYVFLYAVLVKIKLLGCLQMQILTYSTGGKNQTLQVVTYIFQGNSLAPEF